MLATMPYVGHDAKPNRGKFFFYAPPNTANDSHGFKIDGKRVVFFEILSDGKQAVIPPSLHPSDAQYTLFGVEHAVPTLTSDQIDSIWQGLLSIAPIDEQKEAKEREAKERVARKQAARESRAAKRAKRQASQTNEDGHDYESFDWDGFTKDVADSFDLMGYATANFSGEQRDENRGEVRIMGNGGLLVNEDKGSWYCFSDEVGGGCFQLVAYNLYQSDDTSGNWSDILREAADFAGVAWPTFKRSPQAPHAPKIKLSIPDAPKWVADFATKLKIEFVALTLHKITQVTELGEDYISVVFDFNNIDEGLSVIQAPTEKGKTTATVTQITDNLIIAVPTQSLAKQVEKDHGLQAIYENIEPIFSHTNRFVTTYDSVAKIISRCKKAGIDVSSWTLVIDECHHLASDRYRKLAINRLGACIPLFRRVLALSATPPPIVPFFQDAPLLKFTAPQIEKPLFFATCKDYANAIEQALGETKRVIFHLNDKTAIKVLIKELAYRGYKALEFSGDSKGKDHHEGMVYRKEIPDCDVLFVTSLYDDGYNFFDEESYYLMISAKSACSPEQIEQISARLRKQRPVKTILLSKATKAAKAGDTPVKTLYPTFDYAKTLNRELKRAQIDAAIQNEALRKRIVDYKELDPTTDERELQEDARQQLAHDGAYIGLRWDGTQFVTDDLGIHMATFTKWRHACNANRELMIHALKPYNFVFAGEWGVKELRNATKASKERQALLREKLTEERREQIREYVAEIMDFGHAQYIIENRANEGHAQAEYHAASLMMALVDSGVTSDCAKELILDSTMTPNSAINLNGKIRLQKIRFGLLNYGRYLGADVGFYRKLYDIVQIGDVLTKEKLDEIFGRIFADNESMAARKAYSDENEDKQKIKRVRLINKAFKTKRIKQQNEAGKRVDFYQVIGLSPVELTFEPVARTTESVTDSVSDATTTEAATETVTVEPNQMSFEPVARTTESVTDSVSGATDEGDIWDFGEDWDIGDVAARAINESVARKMVYKSNCMIY
jgi:uncharacterized protein YutD